MAERTIKHAQFRYYTVEKGINRETGEERPRMVSHIALRNEVVDIPRQEDIDLGEEHGAFYTEEELHPPEEGDEEAAAVAETAPDENDHEELVNWIRDEKPNAAAVVAAANNDPERAQALIDAENEASGGDPRKTVVEPLQKIADQGSA